MKTKKPAFISIFAIFFAAIISSVLIALFVLLIKQIQILSLDSSSFQAYYTADSAMECAMSKEKAAAAEAYENEFNHQQCGRGLDYHTFQEETTGIG
jgi:uncharacterized membrane protein